jgi:hypothetical protein
MTPAPLVGSPIKLRVVGRADGKPAGFDSAIVGVPGHWYLTVDGERVFLAQLAGQDLRAVAEAAAADVGETLHHADWVITGDPWQVTTLGLMHDCAECRAGVARAVAYLRGNPGSEVAVGQLRWARPPDPAGREGKTS